VQYFNGRSIEEWLNQTAFFTGNAVEVTLYIAPGDKNVSLAVKELTLGEFMGDQPPQDFLCGADSRVHSNYEYVDGRILPIGCSGWITAGGFYITAGHCLDVTSYDLQVIQFHVPPSLCDGTLVPCAIEDQYPIIFSSRVYQNSDVGDDWGIFNVGSNSNTGKTPAEAERSYYHLSKNLAPPNILVRGYGTDHTPAGCTGWYNSDSQTLQYDVGSNLGEYFNGSGDVYFEYLVDTQNGSSGSVLQSNGVSGVTRTAIGVHTYGGCNPPNIGNKGTSFEADDTEAAMNHYWQYQSVYADHEHHLNSTVGTSVKPCVSIQTAVNKANAGHGPGLELILVAGSNNGTGGVYHESLHYSGSVNGVLIRRTVGAVKIGPAADGKPAPLKDIDESENDPSVPRNKKTEQSINFDEKMILPGQTVPFNEIGNKDK
jgi:V8-like Glu-specific endopeptidase